MAKLKTTVSSPAGPIVDLPGRIPAPVAIELAKAHVEDEIDRLQLQLLRFHDWTVTASRGDMRAKTYEEMNATNGR